MLRNGSLQYYDHLFWNQFEVIFAIWIFLSNIFLCLKLNRVYPYILTRCIFYISCIELAFAFCLLFRLHEQITSLFNVTYFFELLIYLILLYGFILTYFESYRDLFISQSHLKMSQKKLEYIATHDALTGLYNRREFERQLHQLSTNPKKSHFFSLFLINIDNFKSINETLGHTQGDKLLKQIAEKLTQYTNENETLYHIGGDEFTIIAKKISTTKKAENFAKKITKGLNTTYQIDEKLICCTVSIGVSCFSSENIASIELLKQAGIALHHIKMTGKNSFMIFSENSVKFSNDVLKERHICVPP